MPESQTITITESINSFIELIRKLKESIATFRLSFQFIYNRYIVEFGKLNASGRKKHYGSFRKIQKLNEKINKFLNNYMTDFSKEYSETLSLAVEINSLGEEFNSFSNRYPIAVINGMGPEELYKRSKRLATITDRHNKLAILYNGRIHRFNALLDNLKSYTIVYEHSKKKKLMTMSISDKLTEFNRLVTESFTSMGLLSANVTSDFLKNSGNIIGSTNLTPIHLLKPGKWTADPQSWFAPSAPGGAKPDSQKYDENLKVFKEREEIMQKAKLMTKAKTLIDFGKNIDVFDGDVKATALKVFMDCQLLSLNSQPNVWGELHKMLTQNPYLAPNLNLLNGVAGLIEETRKLEEKVITYLKTSAEDLENEEDSIKDVFDFAAKSKEASEILSYYKKKGFVLWLQYYFIIYQRDDWIEDVLRRNLSDEFLRHHNGYFKRVHGFTEAIGMEKLIAKEMNIKMVDQIQALSDNNNYEDDMTVDDTNGELRDQLCESFEKISYTKYLIFVDKLEAAEFNQIGKKNEIYNRIKSREESLKLLGVEHEKLLKQSSP